MLLTYFVQRKNCILYSGTVAWTACGKPHHILTVIYSSIQSRQLLRTLFSPVSRDLCTRVSQKSYHSSEGRQQLCIFCLHLTFYQALDHDAALTVSTLFWNGSDNFSWNFTRTITKGSPTLHVLCMSVF